MGWGRSISVIRFITGDVDGANIAVYDNAVEILRWLMANNISPNQDGVNEAVNRDENLPALKLVAKTVALYPNRDGVRIAAASPNSEEISKWLSDNSIYDEGEANNDDDDLVASLMTAFK